MERLPGILETAAFSMMSGMSGISDSLLPTFHRGDALSVGNHIESYLGQLYTGIGAWALTGRGFVCPWRFSEVINSRARHTLEDQEDRRR